MRKFLLTLLLGISLGTSYTSGATPVNAADFPVSELASDKISRRKIGAQLVSIMHKYAIPGGQMCIARGGKIIYMGAFGYVNDEENIPVAHDNLFRIASISKVLTSIAIWQLIEKGRLSLDDKAFEILADLKPREGATADPRLRQITISNLLEHAAGFGQTRGDPQFIYQRAAADAFKEPRPASATSIIRMAMGDPLEYDPGTKSLYSNLGFNILGRVIEHVSGESYENYIKANVLKPVGITSMELGRTSLKEPFAKEAYYWQGQDEYIGWSVVDGEPLLVPHPYGAGFAIEPFDSHGGWISSARDLVRLASALEGVPVDGEGERLVQPRTLQRMLTPVEFALNKETYRAEGVVVTPEKHSWSHTGGMSGTSSFLYSFRGNLVMAGVFNRLPTPRSSEYYVELEALINSLARELR